MSSLYKMWSHTPTLRLDTLRHQAKQGSMSLRSIFIDPWKTAASNIFIHFFFWHFCFLGVFFGVLAFVFLGPHPQHMEVPRLLVESEL